jgi:protease IV
MSRRGFYAKLVLRDAILEASSTPSFLRRGEPVRLRRLLEVLEAIALHPRIRKLFLVVRPLTVGWAQIEEIHRALGRIHAAGKETLCYLEGADNKSYYLASGARRVFMPPSASLDLVGLRAEMFFLKDLLDRLGVQAELFQVGAYKSAGEMFLRRDLSPASREMMESILADLYRRVVDTCAGRCGRPPEEMKRLIDEGPFTALRALDAGLIDGLAYEDEIDASLEESAPKLRRFSVRKLAPREGFLRRILTFRRPRIAYIVAEGIVAHGESRRGPGRRTLLGSSGLADLLRAARESKRVRAVVLRVNSPGGSSLASDLIWREVKLTAEKKPLIVSLGDVAASGGYYIAAAGRRIVANANTLTGSIGVLGGKFSVGELLNSLQIGADAVETGGNAGYASVTRPFSGREAEIVRHQMEDFYERLFLPKVAEGRGRPIDEIRPLAEGRVWTGRQALDVGLVDELGGSSEAIALARRESGLDGRRFRLVAVGRRRTLRDFLPFALAEPPALERVFAWWPPWPGIR